MITGVMNWHSKVAAPEVRFGSFIVGLVLALAVFGSAALILGWVKL